MPPTRSVPRVLGVLVPLALMMPQISMATAVAAEPSTSTSTAPYRPPAGQRQVLLDDHGVARIENLKRTMHRPDKKGAVIRSAPDGQGPSCIQTRTAPVWDREKKIWKFWDCTTPNDLHARHLYCGGYYESRDGLHWSRPSVRQLEYRGSRENNYVFILAEDGKHLRPDCVVYDPADRDPARRFKAAMPPRGFAVSPDGVNWRMLDIPGVPSSDEYNFSLDEQEHLFILTVKRGGPYGRSVYLSTSRDFEHWSNAELTFHADELDQQLGRENIAARFKDATLQKPGLDDPTAYNVDVYNMGVFRYEGLYIGIPAMYHATAAIPNYPNTVGFHLLELTCSRDLKTWQRLGDRKPFLGPSRIDSGAYDLTQILPPSVPILRSREESFSGKEELWFYYTGIKYRDTFKYIGKYPNGQEVHLPGLDPDQGAICLAVLRRDGFVSLDAGEEEGRITTRSFNSPGDRLYLNCDASGGWIEVRLLDDQEQVLALSERLTGDHDRCEVKWLKDALGERQRQTVALRFTIRSASLYSFWFERS